MSTWQKRGTSTEIQLQQKQYGLLEALEGSRAVVLGIGGGRGSGKSSGVDRALITLMYRRPIIACMMMRNFDQVYKYHVEPIRRDFPWLEKGLKTTMPAKLTIKMRSHTSELDFSYAENYDDVVRRFQSGNYDVIVVDQAEQFSEREIREIRRANRSRSGGAAKLVLSFNMRGSGIQTLRKWFYTKEYNRDEDPADYSFTKFDPWDNVQWVLPALEQDGYTAWDYYHWTDEQRKAYAAEKGPYTRQLATDNEVIRQADWEGGWDSIEGAFFANSFDLESIRANQETVERLRKPWAVHWMAQDWGKSHFCATYWAFRMALSPNEAAVSLGWSVEKPINVTVIYREYIESGMESTDIAHKLVMKTPANERPLMKTFFLSPECVTGDPNSIGSQQTRVFRGLGMPPAVKADNDRKGGYMLMGSMFKAAKGHGWGIDNNGDKFQYDDAVLISCECPELLKSIPMLMRDPKDIDDVLKTDKSAAKIEQDCTEACRYLLKSMLSPRKKTQEQEFQQAMQTASPEERMMLAYQHQMRTKPRLHGKLVPSWRGNLQR